MPTARWVAAPPPAGVDARLGDGFSPWLTELLARRGVRDPATARAFLAPSLDQLHSPELLCDLPPAAERLASAAARGERVAIVGDYDVDGVTATALLAAALASCGAAIETLIPHRQRDGYGFQPKHAEAAAAAGCSIVITVDCGIGALEAVARARALGLEVIVTDHHLPGEALPSGAWVVNPRRADCAYPFAELTGAGLAMKLAQAVLIRRGRPAAIEPLLRIACLGTIADAAALVGENRVIAALGLASLPGTRSPGLQALLRLARLRPPIGAEDVSFRIAPRLNAAGRLDSAELALELLMTRDRLRAEELASRLEELNRRRQEQEAAMSEALRPAVERAPEPLIVAWNAAWHRGIVGIVAGRLARAFARPAILFAVEEGVAVGSGRGVAGFDLHRFVGVDRHELLRFGGHAQAIGLSVGVEKLPELAARWQQRAAGLLPAAPEPTLVYELSLHPEQLDDAFQRDLQRLSPHGEGNPQPLLRVGPLAARLPVRSFGDGHLELQAGPPESGSGLRLLGWRFGARREEFGGEFEALAHLDPANERAAPTLRLVDLRRLSD